MLKEQRTLKIRPSAVEGAFYPADPKELWEAVNYYLDNTLPYHDHKKGIKLKALIVPHAGYIYSAPVAAFGYSILKKQAFLKSPKILLLGPSHNEYFSGLGASDFDFWETPLGRIKTDPLYKKIIAENPQEVVVSNSAHEPEHCLEVQIPFLQSLLKEFTILPFLTGEGKPESFAVVLQKYLSKIDLIIVSSDLSHYHPYEDAVKLDKLTVEAISNFDFDTLINMAEACGLTGIITLLYLAKLNKWRPEFLVYQNSGDTAGDKDRVVGYASFAFYK